MNRQRWMHQQLQRLPRLNAEFLKHHPELPADGTGESLPERVLQFGAGVFLRGIRRLDDRRHEPERLVPRTSGCGGVDESGDSNHAESAERQRIRILRAASRMAGWSKKNGLSLRSVAASIPTRNFDEYLECAHNPDLRFIVSNTTEAGIVYRAEDRQSDRPPVSFPAKLTLLLIERYKAFKGDRSKGFVLLPCELIERNGDKLKEAVLQTAANWSVDPRIVGWIAEANIFANTLVDRIVTGFPRDEIQALWQQYGYVDELFNTSEVFHLWVIEGPPALAGELPLREAGFNVIFSDDMTPYRDRKVRILNGAHTATVLAAYQAGENLVGECMKNPLIRDFMTRAIYDEVIPTLTLPKQELDAFAAAVFERFSNPFIHHALLSISLNSVSKYKTRVLPSVEQYLAMKGELPARLTFALAALITFYRGTEVRDGALIGHRGGEEYRIQDGQAILETFARLWSGFDESAEGIRKLTEAVLQREDWWGKDLRQLPACLHR